MTVETTFSEDKIEKIEVVNHYESQGVCEKALFTELPQAILDEQSLAVDTIAGATVASNALISAVRQAAEQAGCDVSALMNAPEKKAPETTEYTADVIIVGAGGAGLSAAVAATDEGASVILIEKEGYGRRQHAGFRRHLQLPGRGHAEGSRNDRRRESAGGKRAG